MMERDRGKYLLYMDALFQALGDFKRAESGKARRGQRPQRGGGQDDEADGLRGCANESTGGGGDAEGRERERDDQRQRWEKKAAVDDHARDEQTLPSRARSDARSPTAEGAEEDGGVMTVRMAVVGPGGGRLARWVIVEGLALPPCPE
jgi:hypothetical protein